MVWEVLVWFRGYVCLKISGLQVERVLNRLTSQGVLLWKVVKCEGYFIACLSVEHFKDMRKILKGRSRCRVRVLQKIGLPFFVAGMGKRVGVLLGFIIFFSLLYTGSSFIWTVEMQGVGKLELKPVHEYLEQEGISKGAIVNNLDANEIEKKLMAEFPSLVWVHVEIIGTLLRITVWDRDDPVQHTGIHLLARRSGVIEEVIVMRGEPLVKAGDTVRKGEILIKGKEDKRAQGIVKARTWYHGIGEAPVLYEERVLTGRFMSRIIISWQGINFVPLGVADIPFEHYTLEKRTLNFDCILPPLDFFSVEVQDIKEEAVYYNYISTPAAGYLARSQALRSALLQIETDVIISGIEESSVRHRDNIIRVRCVIEVLEDIGEQGGENNIDAERNNNTAYQ